MRVVMALTETPGSQPPEKTQAPFKHYSGKLLISLPVFGSFLYHATTCLKKQRGYMPKRHDDLLTCETEKHTFTRWMNALLVANSATTLTSAGCLAVYSPGL